MAAAGVAKPNVKTRRPQGGAVRSQSRRPPSSKALVERGGRYGIGAMARRNGFVPVPGRTGLLTRIQDALSPAEVQARLFSAIKNGRIPSFPALAAALPLARMSVVVRAYGKSISTYFVGSSGAVPSRSAASRATATSVARAVAGSKPAADAARNKAADAGRVAEYRNTLDPSSTPGSFTSAQKRQISSGLRDNRNWTELLQWLGAQTSNITPRLRLLQENRSRSANGHTWNIPSTDGKVVVSMDSGLHLVVASGYASDGSRAVGGAGSRTMFMGRRIDVLSHDPAINRTRLEDMARNWGAALAADYGVGEGADRSALEEAVRMGCPVDISSSGLPMARLVYDPMMRAGGSVLLAASTLGFKDMGFPEGRKSKPGWMHPDNLETIFDQKHDAWADDVASRATPKIPRAVRPAATTSILQKDAFGLDFGQVCPGINPANTAIVFGNARSGRFSLVSRATGEDITGIPALVGLSNLPLGTYLRLNADELDAWRSQGADTAKRMSLSDAANGRTVRVSDGGILSHYDGAGRLHNPLNGPSVVSAVKDEFGHENTPSPMAWHHEGVQMDKEGFETLRSKISLEARATEEKAMEPEFEDTFGLRAAGLNFANN